MRNKNVVYRLISLSSLFFLVFANIRKFSWKIIRVSAPLGSVSVLKHV